MSNPERYLDEMVAGLGKSEQLQKKTSELINNLENERIIQFVKVFCAIEHHASSKTISEEKRTDLLMGLMQVLNEISYDESAMFDRYCDGFYATDETLKIYFPEAYEKQDDIFKQYLDRKILMPDINQMEFAISRGFGHLIFMPGKDAINDLIGELNKEPFTPEIKFPQFMTPMPDPRPMGYYTLALPGETDPFMISDGFSIDGKFLTTRVFGLYQKSQDKIRANNELGIDLQGLTIREYLFMQMSHSANINPNLYTPDNLPQPFLDAFPEPEKYSLILGEKLVKGCLLAKYDESKNHFRFERGYNQGNFTCAPWLALNFKNREETE